jgi:hypothetical protein
MTLIIAATAFLVSLLLHVLTFTTWNFAYNINTIAAILFWPLAVIAVPVALNSRKLGEGLSTFDRKTLQFAPPALRNLWFASFAYMFLTILIVMKYSPVVQNGFSIRWYPPERLSIRILTAFAMCFYCGSVSVEYTARCNKHWP